MGMFLFALGILFLVTVSGVLIVFLSYIPLWIQVQVSGVQISFFSLVGMRLRGLSPKFVCNHLITLRKAGVTIEATSLEAHVLSGGNLDSVSNAIISANKAGLGFSFAKIAAIDLAGRDVVGAVNNSVVPKVLQCPGKGSDKLLGVAKDGVRLDVKVRITVRTNFDRLIGGANEKTIIARVGEGVVAAIGSSVSHKEILEKPELISQYILSRGLDRGSSFEILSVDVSQVEILDNVGAYFQEIQAETDKQVAQAKAEMRRVAAVAREREMKAKVMEMTSQLTFARSVIPKSLASGLIRGNVWRSPNPVVSCYGRRLWDYLDN